MSHWIRQFSLPQEPADEQVFNAIVGTHESAIVSWIITTYREDIARTSEGLIEFVLKWAQDPALSSQEIVWDLAFGYAQLLFKKRTLDATEVAVRIALRLTENGYLGTWRATIPSATLRLGAMLLPAIEGIEVDSNNSRGLIIARTLDHTEIKVIYDHKNGLWQADGVEHLYSFGINRPIYLLTAGALPPDAQSGPGFEGTRPVSVIDNAMLDSFGEGIRTLAKYAPDYLPWVERVLHGIVVCPLEEGNRLVSGSKEEAPGVIHVSYPIGHMDIAEVLVHECAHQYFYMLQKVGPVDDDSDKKLYWSPPIRRERPLSRILMAYHALANVLLFYESVRTSNANSANDDMSYVEANEPDMKATVATLDLPLRNNPALTEFGRGLYEPLSQLITALEVNRARVDN